ncbi:SpoIIAA family protein [Rubinisphaera brasiliensis]|uniref:STAS/SEC14 domain-containing protein n=1 Tax=Rubinisphaera brasiliensis (strain ATCC 49424 / DSM 5305 / JCM 21570 / IAM 15109 / NBRC 103401 / IFAM 1448) TaxID=756272 RepID=F0SJ19_RUBBR|nr:STAS/SEC14 domain-containing protein [Rubinisphaera brasiliensis]ADY58561.1 hypothetical protein Plabr_0940 [Rubinisphaera brasiliensis DSM 5305]
MMTLTHDPETNIVELDIDGEITPENFDETLTTLRAIIGEHGKIRLLKHVRSIQFPPIPMSRMWDDFKFVHEHLGDITHVASVTDVSGVESMVKLLNPMFKAEMKHFKSAELEAAREWLQNA